MNGILIAGEVLGAIIILVAVILILKKMKGSIAIEISEYNYSPGDTIDGNVKLNLKKPVTSGQMKISLIGERRDRDIKQNSTRSTRVFDFSQPLGKKGQYSPGESSFKFKIKIPSNVLSKSTGNQVADTLIKSAQMLAGTRTSVKWYLIAELECEGINLSKKVQVNIA